MVFKNLNNSSWTIVLPVPFFLFLFPFGIWHSASWQNYYHFCSLNMLFAETI